MGYEIELKVWVDEPEQTEKELEKRYSFDRQFRKRDTYYRFPEKSDTPDRTVRIRREGSSSFVTSKIKKVVEDLEENEELELEVSDPDKIEALIQLLGCRFLIRKEKTGKRYIKGNLILELSRITDLGWFLEIEKVLEERTEDSVRAARGEISQTLKEIGISEEKIETRFYNDMLLEIQAGPTGKS